MNECDNDGNEALSEDLNSTNDNFCQPEVSSSFGELYVVHCL